MEEQKLKNLKRKLLGEMDESAKSLKEAVDAKKLDRFPYKHMVSASMFERFTECPRQWELRYKDKRYEPEDNENTIYGDSIHRLVENYMGDKENEKYESEENIRKVVKNAVKKSAEDVKERFDDGASENREYPFTPEILQKMVEDAFQSFSQYIEFEKQFFDNGLELISVEEEFKGKTFHNLEFRGKVDLIFYNERKEEFYIIDIKSSSSSWKNEEVNLRAKKVQILSYKFYFSESLDIPLENIRTAFVVLNRKGDAEGKFNHIETISIDSSKEKIEWMIEQWRDFIKKITTSAGYFKDKTYELNPSERNCKRCPYSTEFNGNGVCNQGGNRWNNK